MQTFHPFHLLTYCEDEGFPSRFVTSRRFGMRDIGCFNGMRDLPTPWQASARAASLAVAWSGSEVPPTVQGPWPIITPAPQHKSSSSGPQRSRWKTFVTLVEPSTSCRDHAGLKRRLRETILHIPTSSSSWRLQAPTLAATTVT